MKNYVITTRQLTHSPRYRDEQTQATCICIDSAVLKEKRTASGGETITECRTGGYHAAHASRTDSARKREREGEIVLALVSTHQPSSALISTQQDTGKNQGFKVQHYGR
ncbi:hypothetical protein Pmani_028575 [Petrolisthes manimaculis]|uniref:Uncharacterized protein n=1 Tax=Petrolisthes manimaculis TaxID=1843537 RepID=A0AAE1TXW8_9EUCA|nr:hypothetical protein Pmani_028575 [Petrolisthes manimaculis]